MAFADTRSGWRLPGLAATVTAHLALLAVAASAFNGVSMSSEPQNERLVALLTTPVPRKEETRDNTRQAKPALAQDRRPASAFAAPRVSVKKTGHEAALASASHAGPSPEQKIISKPATSIGQTLSSAQDAPLDRRDLLSAYAGHVRDAIMQRRPRGLREQGTTVVAFRLDRSGTLISESLAQSSGDMRLDQLALRMVRQAAPFDAPPAAIPDSALTFALPIRFH